MGEKTYALRIDNETAAKAVVILHGNLEEVLYVGKGRVKEMAAAGDTQFSVTFIEEDTANGRETREVTRFTGKGRTAAKVLKDELSEERKQATAETTAEPTPVQTADEQEQDPRDTPQGY